MSDDGMIEFDCEGCGVHVIAYGRDTVPKSGLCSTCEWACEFVPDPEEMMELLRLCGNLPPVANRKGGADAV